MRRGFALVGLLLTLVGLAMVFLAFWLAYDLYKVPPTQAMSIVPGKPMDFGQVMDGLVKVFIRALMLVLMAAFGSMFANRGIRLYEADRRSRIREKRADRVGEVTDDTV